MFFAWGGVKMERFYWTMHCKQFIMTVQWSFHKREQQIVVAGSR